MKKKIIIPIGLIIIILYFVIYNVFSSTSNFHFSLHSKKDSVTEKFNKEYSLTNSSSDEDSKLEKEIISLTKKTTYLLLGDFNMKKESSEKYYKRHQDYLDLRYAPTIPKDESTSSGLDENSSEYKDDLVSGFAVPSLFLQMNELEIEYQSFGDIRITKNDNMVISMVILPNVKMKEQNAEDPMKYDKVQTNLVLYYYFKKLDGEYKLYYLYGETKDVLDDYLSNIESIENKSSMSIAPSYDSNLKNIYNYEKLESMSDSELNQIYESNVHNVVQLNAYYNNMVIISASGFFINDGLIVTTWNFMEKALIDAQYFTIKDNRGNTYEIDGIVTARPELDIVVIKLKNKTSSHVTLASNFEVEDPAIVISSKTGVGMTVQSGIVISVSDYVQTSIPLSQMDEGSPLLDKNGQIIGMNTADSTNASISIAISSNVLKEVQEKFNLIDFDSIETISFEQLKEEYYYVKYHDETIKNNIPSSKWKTYSKIGNIEETIQLQLVKSSYKDGIVSLRYKNSISKYISSMQLASSFKEKLMEEGYEVELNSSTKCIYKSDRYRIIIMDEFDYLIVVMVRL